jgi:hypothetical protein
MYPVQLSNTLAVSGAATLYNTLQVIQGTTMSNLYVNGNIYMTGTGGGTTTPTIYTDSASNLYYNTSGTSQTWTFGSGGSVTPAMTLDNTGLLTMTGDINAYGTISLVSDRRLKRNITPIQNALAKVEALNGVDFEYITSGDKSLGLIAQEVEAVAPNAVLTRRDGYKSVAYANLIGLLVEAIKELSVGYRDLVSASLTQTRTSLATFPATPSQPSFSDRPTLT